ncbi:unnamed protein product [Candida verbasci]|uniref:PX domain-containing protein n=1 Tax=Candida verbasci TaxID=1227364 RepID=A0A9W4U152_9ASCO|nr:unnamed protein product [Candida verbasci]
MSLSSSSSTNQNSNVNRKEPGVNDNNLYSNSNFIEEDEDNSPFVGLSITQNNSNFINNGSTKITDPEDEEADSMLLYNNSHSERKNSKGESFDNVSVNYESKVSKLLISKIQLQIIEAANSNESSNNSSKKYVVYTIRIKNLERKDQEILTRRRYSDFESLREILTKIFPLIIIPPIPTKNYFDFSKLNLYSNQTPNQNVASISNSQSNVKLIENRKRLLNNFLNSCLEINQIRKLEFFAKFLDPNANWKDEIALIQSQLPKSIYLSNPDNSLKTDVIYSNLPDPTHKNAMGFFKNNQKKLTKNTTELLNTNNEDIINLDELNKRIMSNYVGLSHDYSELGIIFNSFSLIISELPRDKSPNDKNLNVIFDKIGQCFDRSYIVINSLIGELETKFSEPLGELVQYSNILQDISKFKARKLRQKILLDNDIKEKRKDLSELLQETTNDKTDKYKYKIPSFKKITQYVNDIIDQNPEQTKKEKTISLQDKIKTLEKCQEIMLADLVFITDEINKNQNSFHKKQLKTIYKILFAYNQHLISWAKKNVEIWEEFKNEILKA